MDPIQSNHNKIAENWKKLIAASPDDFEPILGDLIISYENLGEYTPEKWDPKRVNEWLENCEKLAESSYSPSIIKLLRYKISTKATEGAVLIFQELLWCSKNRDMNTLTELVQALKLFPNNPWFKMIRCNVMASFYWEADDLLSLENDFIQCLAHLHSLQDKRAMSGYYLFTGVSLFRKYIQHHDLASAKRIKLMLDNTPTFNDSVVYSNTLMGLYSELSQAQAMFKLQESTEQKIADIANNANKKNFEQLVIFTAIITFVITAAGSAIKSPIPLWEIVGLGMTLLIFVVAIMLCLDSPTKQELNKDFRFWVLRTAFVLTALLAGVNAVKTIDVDLSECLFNCSYSLNVKSSFAAPKHEEFPITPPWRLDDIE